MGWCFFIFQVISFFLKSSAELITSLPGQPSNVSFKQYSGNIVTDARNGRALFYYFVQADVSEPLSRPLTLWLNGGPGCSSLGFGAFMEHGPFRPGNNGLLIKNHYSWNLESNMLYLETPIGVGFSYSNTSENYIDWNDTKTAQENLNFLLSWFEEFPRYRDSDLYLTGESYAGHYIPQLAALVVEYNKKPNIKPIKLKAIALGNPLLDLDISINAGEFLWSHGAISDETLMLERTVCNDSRYLREYVHDKWSQGCNDVFNRVADEIGDDIDRSDLLLSRCVSASTAQQSISQGLHRKIQAKLARGSNGDPCLQDRVLAYLNKPEVQKALHANTTGLPFRWDFCLGSLVYQEDNMDMNLIPLVSSLLKEGIPIMFFSGDQDTKIPLTQTRIIANQLAQQLKLFALTPYAPWYNKKQIGGWAQLFGGPREGKNVTYITFATVRGAAHEVPFTSPSQALTLFRALLGVNPLRIHPGDL
ncbi:serine carboxypeptidase-like 46 [Magnolia sinica]|uniref:serine carboxypeptidase-like 46 n=1 Tax=Magnolia sinica TaxID=86752 RepID=UPI0026585CC2|nr:serine carboxypeptidase-like 46 [Magnolia sinica]